MRKRRWLSYPGTDEGKVRAQAEADRLNSENAEDDELDRNVTVEKYIENWLELAKARLAEQTYAYHRSQLRHLEPLYPIKVRDLTRRRLVRFFTALIGRGDLARSTIALLLTIVRSMLQEAVDEDALLPANPAQGIRKKLDLRHHDNAAVKAMEGHQLEAFLEGAKKVGPGDHLMMALYAHSGLRMGEGLGLEVGDLELDPPRRLRVERQILNLSGKVALPKGGKKRLVDISDELAELLAAGLIRRKEYLLKTGIRSEWLFYPDLPAGKPRQAASFRVSAVMARSLDLARLPDGKKLPGHFTPHCLRHTYATLLLQRGEDLLYVSRQLGHAQVSITADRYGKWLVLPPHRGGPNLLSKKKPLADMLSKA